MSTSPGRTSRMAGANLTASMLRARPTGKLVAAKPPLMQYNVKGFPVNVGASPCAFYMKTGTCAYGPSCKFDHPDEATSNKELNSAGYPLHAGQPQCSFFMRTGTCKFGALCRFSHPEGIAISLAPGAVPAQSAGEEFELIETLDAATKAAGAEDDPSAADKLGDDDVGPGPPPRLGNTKACEDFLVLGVCKEGTSCRWNHPDNWSADVNLSCLNFAGYPINTGAPLCLTYLRTGVCRNGFTCDGAHPEPPDSEDVRVETTGLDAILRPQPRSVDATMIPRPVGSPRRQAMLAELSESRDNSATSSSLETLELGSKRRATSIGSGMGQPSPKRQIVPSPKAQFRQLNALGGATSVGGSSASTGSRKMSAAANTTSSISKQMLPATQSSEVVDVDSSEIDDFIAVPVSTGITSEGEGDTLDNTNSSEMLNSLADPSCLSDKPKTFRTRPLIRLMAPKAPPKNRGWLSSAGSIRSRRDLLQVPRTVPPRIKKAIPASWLSWEDTNDAPPAAWGTAHWGTGASPRKWGQVSPLQIRWGPRPPGPIGPQIPGPSQWQETWSDAWPEMSDEPVEQSWDDEALQDEMYDDSLADAANCQWPTLDDVQVDAIVTALQEGGGALPLAHIMQLIPGLNKAQLETHFMVKRSEVDGQWEVRLPGGL